MKTSRRTSPAPSPLSAERSRELQLVLHAQLQELQTRTERNKLKAYAPHPRQREFHRAGAQIDGDGNERLFMAGNQLGKTLGGGFEWAMHLTGRYPDWWDGAVFDKAPQLWAAGVTGESTRDNPQRVLLGPPELRDRWGTGCIPHDAISDWNPAMGVPNLLDNVQVEWGGGGDVQRDIAICTFKFYEKGREKWQGPTKDGIWFDEEPPEDIYSEGRTRTQKGQRGVFTITTFTPLLGMSKVVTLFLGQSDVEAMA